MPLTIHSPAEQVATHLREQLLSNRWRQELPGTPSLSKELNVDRKTIMAAIKVLESEGLLESQGPGRPRRVKLPTKKPSHKLDIHLLPYEHEDTQRPFIIKLISELEKAGHTARSSSKTLPELRMSVKAVARYIEKEPADLWIPIAGSRELLTWFAEKDIPTFALFGRRRNIPIGSIGPDKETALIEAIRHLISLGHRRIVYMARTERRKPNPGHIERCFLRELESHGIATSQFNLPHWDDNREGFHRCIDNLFQHTPPTTMIFDEAQFLIAFSHRLMHMGLKAPDDVSIICQDDSSSFYWCEPQISHIHWATDPLVRDTLKWINNFSRGIHQRETIYTEAKFVEGETIGPVPR